MDTQALLEHRAAKDDFFKNSPQSPIPPDRRASFTGLTYYDPDPDLVFTVPVDVIDPEPTKVGTTTGEERIYHKIGTVTLPIEDEEVSLALYSTGHPGLFLPLRDATSGTETYGAGRYLDVEPQLRPVHLVCDPLPRPDGETWLRP